MEIFPPNDPKKYCFVWTSTSVWKFPLSRPLKIYLLETVALKSDESYLEMIFPEALQDEKEFEAFRKAISVPLLANMTEFGKSKLSKQAEDDDDDDNEESDNEAIKGKRKQRFECKNN